MMKKLTGALGCAAMLFALSAYGAPAIKEFEPDSMERIVTSQKGKPFVLVIWSLDCEYCQASFKVLAQESKRRKLNVVTLTTDTLDDAQVAQLIKKKLGAAGIGSNAWAFGAAPPEQLRYAIDSKWHGEKPRSYWFNARGERTAYSGVITPEVVARFSAQ